MISIHFLAVSLPEESYILSGRKISNSIIIFLLSDRLSRRSIWVKLKNNKKVTGLKSLPLNCWGITQVT